jgi:hypothetical protein
MPETSGKLKRLRLKRNDGKTGKPVLVKYIVKAWRPKL